MVNHIKIPDGVFIGFPDDMCVGQLVVKQQIIKPDSVSRNDHAVNRYVFLQGTTGTQADDRKLSLFVLNRSCGKVNIYQRVDFIKYNIDIPRPYTRTDDAYLFTTQSAGVRNKFPVLGSMSDTVKMLRHFLYPVRAANRYYSGRKMLGRKVEVVNGATLRNNQFCIFNRTGNIVAHLLSGGVPW